MILSGSRGAGGGSGPVNGFINTEEMGSLTPSSPTEKESPTARLGTNKARMCVCVCVGRCRR